MHFPARCISLALLLAATACDPAVADDGFGGPGITSAATTAAPHRTDDADGSSGYGPDTLDPSTTGGETTDPGAADDTTTGDEDDADPTTTTASPTFPPTTTGGGGDDSSTGDAGPAPVDVVLAVDLADGAHFALARLATQVVSTEAQLVAAGVADVRWAVLPYLDTVGAIDTLEGWGSDPDAHAAATAVGHYAYNANGVQVPPAEGLDEDPASGAALDALHGAATWQGWRPEAARWVVLVGSSGLVEPPAVLSGHAVTHTYEETAAALAAGEVRVLGWTPVGSPGLAAPWGDAPSLLYAWHDLAPEQAVPDALPPTGSMFAAGIAADIVAALAVDMEAP